MHLSKRKSVIIELGFKPEQLDTLEKYIDLLWASNEELNLISRQMTMDELIDNHIIDCLLPLKLFPQNIQKTADLGSGGGLPAIIYALQFPNIEFHLFEKSIKKQIFLNKCKNLAPNIFIHGEIPQDLSPFQIITARGFKPTDVILDMTRSYFNNGGKYFLLKARLEKIEEELKDSSKKFKNIKHKLTKLTSPVLDVERHLLEIN